MTQTWYSAGDMVARKGEPATSWIGVTEGLLKVSSVLRCGKVVMFAGIPEGCWVGEGSVMKEELRKYDLTAIRNCHLLHVPASTFRWLLQSSLEFNQLLIERLNARLGQSIGMVEIDRLSDPVARIARCIASFFDPVLYPRREPWLRLSQFELSELVGVSRTTISLGLRRLELEGLLSTRYGKIVVHHLSALRSYEGSDLPRALRQEVKRVVRDATVDDNACGYVPAQTVER